MSETENLPSASETKTNGENDTNDQNSYPSVDSKTVQEDEEEQSEANTSGDIDMLDAEWVVQDEVHSDDGSEITTNGDTTEKQDNVEEAIVKEPTLPTDNKPTDNGVIAEKLIKIKRNSIEGMDIDLDNNISDNSIVVQEEEEDALLKDEVDTKETTPEVMNVDDSNMGSKDLNSSGTVPDVDNVTSSSSDTQKSDNIDEKINLSGTKDNRCNMSDVITLDEETMSETEKPDSTLVEDSKKCIKIDDDDDDDDIMLVDDGVENIKKIAKFEDKVNIHEETENNQELEPDESNYSKVDDNVRIEDGQIEDGQIEDGQIDEAVKNKKEVQIPDVDEIHKVDEALDNKLKNKDEPEIDNIRINDETKIINVENDNIAEIAKTQIADDAKIIEDVKIDDRAQNDIVEIEEEDAKVVDKMEKLGENHDIGNINEVNAVEVIKKDNFAMDEKVKNSNKLNVNETSKMDDLDIPCEEAKIKEIPAIFETNKVEDKPKMDKAKIETEGEGETNSLRDNCGVHPESEISENFSDSELKIKSSIDDETFKADALPSDYDVPLGKMVEGLDEKTIIFIDDAVKSGFKNILISDQSVEKKPLIQSNFIKTFSKKLSDMTRDDLEEFCLLKIVEGIVERSTLSDATAKLKSLMQHVDEWRKKAQQLQKQNRDLSVVLRNIQDEHRKRAHGVVTPLKITRSVGLQVTNPTNINNQNNQNIPNVPMAEPRLPKQKKAQSKLNASRNQKRSKTPVKSVQKNTSKPSTLNVPVPRLVPVSSSPPKQTPLKNLSATTNGINTILTKPAEKRPLSELNNSIDLTDDEPPSKQIAVTSPSSVMRLVNSAQPGGGGQRMAIMVNSPLGFTGTSPRQVYIPIAGQGAQAAIRTGQTLMFAGGPRSKVSSQINPPPLVRNKVEFHDPSLPPLPGSYRQVHLPNWKWIPPSPELKISRVDTESTSIVISWMLKDFDENKHEKVVSYQIYAYHESNARVTSSASWIKIGDVKALPLPMACTLSQFKMQNKYHFVVRGVDAKSRVGPFSPPGSIVLVKHPSNAINGVNK